MVSESPLQLAAFEVPCPWSLSTLRAEVAYVTPWVAIAPPVSSRRYGLGRCDFRQTVGILGAE